jgi:hypothetical protein
MNPDLAGHTHYRPPDELHMKCLQTDIPVVAATKAGFNPATLETDVHKVPPADEQIMRVQAFVGMLA